MIIKFSNHRFRFIDSFAKFDLSTIKKYMDIHIQVEHLIEQSEVRLAKLQAIETDESKEPDIAQILEIDAELTDLQFQITSKRIDMLSALCYNSKKFDSFIYSTKGITKDLINHALAALFDKLGNFTDFWNNCPDVSYFKVKIKGKLRKQKFKVHEFDKTTLVRETLARVQAETALNHKAQLDSGAWDNICKFIAILVRPSNEVEEISHTKKAFIQSKEMKSLSNSEKLSLYLERLESTWTKRAKDFESLSLTIAIGVLKYYFQKKKNSLKNTSKSLKRKARA